MSVVVVKVCIFKIQILIKASLILFLKKFLIFHDMFLRQRIIINSFTNEVLETPSPLEYHIRLKPVRRTYLSF